LRDHTLKNLSMHLNVLITNYQAISIVRTPTRYLFMVKSTAFRRADLRLNDTSLSLKPLFTWFIGTGDLFRSIHK
jgi:hypothetical protein